MPKKYRINLTKDSYDLYNNHHMSFTAEEVLEAPEDSKETETELSPEEELLATLLFPPKDPEVCEAYFAAQQELEYCEQAIDALNEAETRFMPAFNMSSPEIYGEVDLTMRKFIVDAAFLRTFVRESSNFAPLADDLQECSNHYAIHQIARECADNVAAAYEAYLSYIVLKVTDESVLNEFNSQLSVAEETVAISISIMAAIARKSNMFVPPSSMLELFDFSMTRAIAKEMGLSYDSFKTPSNDS